MSVRLEIQWDNLDDYRTHLARTMPKAFEDSVIEALNETAIDAKARAKELVPVDTGSLRKSIRRERHAWPAGKITYTGVRAGGYIVNPRTKKLVDYARYVCYGTSRQRPQPFMRPALAWAMKKMPDHFWKALSKRVKVE